MISDISDHNSKFPFQHQRVYSPTHQLGHGMGSLRRPFQLQLMAGRSHFRLCSWCLSGTNKLRPSEEPEPQSVRHIVLHTRVFLSARSDQQVSLLENKNLCEINNCPTRCDLFSLLYFCRQLYRFRV